MLFILVGLSAFAFENAMYVHGGEVLQPASDDASLPALLGTVDAAALRSCSDELFKLDYGIGICVYFGPACFAHSCSFTATVCLYKQALLS